MNGQTKCDTYTLKNVRAALRRKELILQCATTWMNLENHVISEMSQTQRDKYCMIPPVGGPHGGQRVRKKDAGRGARDERQLLNGIEFQLCKVKKPGSCTTTCRYYQVGLPRRAVS